MSTIASSHSTSCVKERNEIFQDLPLIDKTTRLTVMEMKYSDKQIINELVYRWCRVITRNSKRSLDKFEHSGPTDTVVQDFRKVLIIDPIGSINPIRLGTVMKRDERRMRMIGIARGCKINSTYVTLSSYLGRQANLSSPLKLVVIYQDEFFIMKTLTLVKDCLKSLKCQVLLVLPRLDRQEQDVLNLISNYQILRCDFCVNRREIGPAPPEKNNDSYQRYLNQIYFQRFSSMKSLPERVQGELREDGLHLISTKPPPSVNKSKGSFVGGTNPSMKRIKTEISINSL